ncbi:MAG: type IV pilus modification PilV family protein [Opitutales bacterium]
MTPPPSIPSVRRPGFTLVEVILAVGVVGVALASLIGILTSSFQQVDDIMQTNRALTAAQGLVTALDNPRSILKDISASAGISKNDTSGTYLPSVTGLDNATGDAPNFDLVYNLLKSADTPANGVWLYVYERKQVIAAGEIIPTVSTGASAYKINGNPSLIEVVRMTTDEFPVDVAQARNVIGSPMRVRLTLSRLLVGQRVTLDATTGEPTTATYASGALPSSPDSYALAYLPIVAEFFPHEYESKATFTATTNDQQPVLVQTIVINR